MKKIIAAAIMIVATTMSFAQESAEKKEVKTAEERAKARTERMAKQLDLSEEQNSKVYEIHLNAMKAGEAQRAEHKADKEISKEDRQAAKMELEKNTHASMREVLNDDQMVKYESMLAKKAEKKDNRRHSPKH